jgi:hypothetical protein
VGQGKGIYGKINFCMKNPKVFLTGTPPRLIPTLLKGFNTIANHWYLVFFPIAVDLLLWLGPKLRLKDLASPFISLVTENMLKISPPELTETVQQSQTLWVQILEQFNLLAALRTFPVGVPSIIARQLPLVSPFQQSLIFEVPSTRLVVTILGLLLLFGFLLGSLYFMLIARVTSLETEPVDLKSFLAAYVQSLTMFCLFVAVVILIAIPLLMFLSLLSLISAGIGQFFLLVALFAMIWLVMPLVFAPHGLFVLRQRALPSMLISVRLVRLFLPGTGLFVMTCILISEGLNKLWTVPEPTSWLTLLGIGGHAFIITGLLAASFIYYREGLKWMQDNVQRMTEMAKMKQENGGTPLEQ